MKYSVFIIAILIFFSGCSSTSGTNETAGGGGNPIATNSNLANSNEMTAATNSKPIEMVPYNGVQNLNANAFNAANSNIKVVPYQPKKDEMPYGSRLAPDDSYITSGSRGNDFFETRIFKSDPVLAKVEKIMDGKTTKYKVYLKNGKVLDAPAEKMSNMDALAPASILDAVGMTPKPPPATAPNPEEKKEQKQ
jgi:hypothetical protein